MVRIRLWRVSGSLRTVLVTLAWGLMTSAVLTFFVFQGYFVPGFNMTDLDPSLLYVAYGLVFLVAVLSGMVLSEFSSALTSYFASLAVAGLAEYFVLTLPSTLGLAGVGVLAEIGIPPVPDLALTIVFFSLFPVVLLVGLVGSVTGAIFSEKFLI